MSYETDLQQNNLDLEAIIEECRAMPSTAELLQESKNYTNSVIIGENMLLNWDFRNPINQRGVTSWTNGYGIDMWIAGVTANTVKDGCITLTASYFTQYFEKFQTNGKVHTVSIMSADGVIDSAQLTPQSTDHVQALLFDSKIEVIINNAPNGFKSFNMRMVNSGDTMDIAAVKLELGTVSTLAMSAPMQSTIELLKCRRYFYAANSGGWGHFGTLVGTGDKEAIVYMPLMCEMRLYNPSIVKAENLYYTSNPLTVTAARNNGGCSLYLEVTGDNITASTHREMISRGDEAKLWISAEL